MFSKSKSVDVSSLIEKDHANCSNKEYTDKHLTKLAKVLESSSILETLDLDSNKIKLANGVFANALGDNCTLTILNLSNNFIGAEGCALLGGALQKNSTLQELNLASNKIGAEGAKSLANGLGENSTLERLDLASNELRGQGAVHIADALMANQSLKKINLSFNEIEKEGTTSVAEVLKCNNSLEELDLSENSLKSTAIIPLSDSLVVNNSLHILNLAGNDIRKDGVLVLAYALRVLNRSLKELDLKKNPIGDEGIEAFADSLKLNKGLLKLGLQNIDISCRGAELVAAALHKNQNLQQIDLSVNNIKCEGAAKVAKSLVMNQTLQKIDLGHNEIGDEGIVKIAKALRHNNTLRGISLTNTKVGDEGAEKLADALKKNKSLQELHLSDNVFSSEGAEKLACVLKVNQALLRLQLKHNNISTAGVASLAGALKFNHTLLEIDLSETNIGDDGAELLADALLMNQSLQKLCLRSNSISDKGVLKLSDSLRLNRTWHEIDLAMNNSSKDYLKNPHFRKSNRQPEPNSTREKDADSQPSLFFSKLVGILASSTTIDLQLDELILLISDVHMMKFYFTVVSSLLRSEILQRDQASRHILGGLEKTTQLCVGEDDIADFKIILEKAETDGYIERRDFFRLDNRAEVRRMEHAPFILSIMEAVRSNTARIEGLEANAEAITNSVNAIKKGLKHKMKVEATVGFLSATINAISFGVGGNIIDATAKALGSIVDYGDLVHIEKVASRFGDDCVEQVKMGGEIAANRYADRLLQNAIKKGDVLAVVSAAAAMMDPSYVVPNDSETEDDFKAKGNLHFKEGRYSEAAECYSRAIELNSSNHLLFSNRSAAYLKLDEAENALSDANAAVMLDQNFLRGYLRKGKALQALRRFKEAEVAFEEGLVINPDDCELQKGLRLLREDEDFKSECVDNFKAAGDSAFRQGNFPEAITQYTNAINISDSNHLLYSNRSAAYLSNGDAENALNDAVFTHSINQTFARGFYRKGKALHVLKRFEESIFCFEEGLALHPHDAELRRGLDLVLGDPIFKTSCQSGEDTNESESTENSESWGARCEKEPKVEPQPAGDSRGFSKERDSGEQANEDHCKREQESECASDEFSKEDEAPNASEESFGGEQNFSQHQEQNFGENSRFDSNKEHSNLEHNSDDDFSAGNPNEGHQNDRDSGRGYSNRGAPNNVSSRTAGRDERTSTHSSGLDAKGEVKTWLLAHLPRLNEDDIAYYTEYLIFDGFDSLDMLDALLEEDLHFMKKAHKRVLLQKLNLS